MNRLEMAEQIAQRVPLLAKRNKEERKSAEKLRIGFVADYPISRICALTLDEYVIGKGSDSRSFCYRLEREMDSLGRILGATAFKFGVYFGRTKSDPLEQYRFRSHWGSNLEESFSSVKDAIADLLRAAAKGDAPAIAKNPLSPMVKGKLLFVYNPEKFAPIYSTEHLKHFIAELDLSGSFDCGADMQRALMDYRATWPDLQAQPVPLYMRLLYDLFGYPPDNESRTATPASVPLLDEAVKGAKLIQQMPAPSGKSNLRAQSIGKTDYEVHQKQLKRIGDRGEAIVFALEKQRLLQAGKPNLAKRVKHLAQETDGAGYDILSFDADGTARQIEVKATSASNLDRGFYISSNELEKSAAVPNYYIYLVFSALGKKPRVLPMRHPVLKGSGFVLSPVAYLVTLGNRGVKK